MDKSRFNNRFILGITLVSPLGGFLFGYDWVVIGGAKPFYERFLYITNSPHLLGAGGLAVIYFVLGSFFYLEMKGLLVLMMVILAIGTYALTLAPITWIVLSDIFPNNIRGTAMAITTTALWIACFPLNYNFSILNKLLNESGTFWLYAIICCLGFLFIFNKLPETRGKSLEEVEAYLTKQICRK